MSTTIVNLAFVCQVITLTIAFVTNSKLKPFWLKTFTGLNLGMVILFFTLYFPF